MTRRTISIAAAFLLTAFAVFAQQGEDHAVRVMKNDTAVSLAPRLSDEDARPESIPRGVFSLLPESHPIALGVNGLSFVGNVSYEFVGATARLKADKVSNSNSSRTSGTLRMSLWMSALGFRGTGYRTATYRLGELQPNYYFYNIDSGTIAFTLPPADCYYVSMLLEEYQSSGQYEYVDYVDFDNRVSVNGACNAPPPPPPPPPPPCSYSLSQTSASVSASGGSGSVNVIGSPTGCIGSWSASNNNSWISLTSGTNGTGAGPVTLSYSVVANSSYTSRTGSITLAGQSFTITQPGISITCSANDSTLCLVNGRFAVSAVYRLNDGSSGQGHMVPLTSDTGYFWFFGPNNVELVVKVLDGCGLSQRFWVFAGGLTNVNVVITIRDTRTGIVRTYTNPSNTAFQPIQDTGAFATCS